MKLEVGLVREECAQAQFKQVQLEGQLKSEMASLEKYKADANTLIRKSSELKRSEID